jgi:CRISPR-associated endonuclease/helicase Cas3
MMRITTLPVYSKLANPRDIPNAIQDRLPDNLRLSEHQLATYHALTGDADVIFNTAMTGDGKSLAGLLPMLVHEHSTVSMYPTNELIRDQLRQSALSLQRWNRKDIPVDQLDAQQLDVFVTQRAQRRAEVLRSFLRNHELVRAFNSFY